MIAPCTLYLHIKVGFLLNFANIFAILLYLYLQIFYIKWMQKIFSLYAGDI